MDVRAWWLQRSDLVVVAGRSKRSPLAIDEHGDTLIEQQSAGQAGVSRSGATGE
jgi:hypothetical protein